jgi:hypothetical protein
MRVSRMAVCQLQSRRMKGGRHTSIVAIVRALFDSISHLSDGRCLSSCLVPPHPYTSLFVVHQSLQSVVQGQRSMAGLLQYGRRYDQGQIRWQRDQQIDLRLA